MLCEFAYVYVQDVGVFFVFGVFFPIRKTFLKDSINLEYTLSLKKISSCYSSSPSICPGIAPARGRSRGNALVQMHPSPLIPALSKL